MNSLIDALNSSGARALHFAWPILWQSSLLIAVVLALDIGLRRRLRAAVRYGLWLIVLVKLLLPPSLALPTGLAWWLRSSAPPSAAVRDQVVVVSYAPGAAYRPFSNPETPRPLPRTALSVAGGALLGSGLISSGLLLCMLLRWVSLVRQTRRQQAAPARVAEILHSLLPSLGIRYRVSVRLVPAPMSPAVCGLFRPVILLPRSLVNQLSAAQVRAVLLHELCHLRRGDVWVNCLQALLQAIYWWHPLLWLANARARRAREEAVDDSVMGALHQQAGIYAPTLLQVARLALSRPPVTLGLVGILESKAALQQRLERLIDFRPSRTPGLTLLSFLGLLVFSATALPMGESPARQSAATAAEKTTTRHWPDPRFQGYAKVDLQAEFFIGDLADLRSAFSTDFRTPLIVASNELDNLKFNLKQANARPFATWASPLFEPFSGGRFQYRIGDSTNNSVNYHTRQEGAATTVIGAEIQCAATEPDWTPLQFTVVPWTEGAAVLCHLQLALDDKTNSARQAVATIPPGGAMLWGISKGAASGKLQFVLLTSPAPTTSEPATPAPPLPPVAGDQKKETPVLVQSGKLEAHETTVTNEFPSRQGSVTQPLFTRNIKLDPNTFSQSLKTLAGVNGDTGVALRHFLQTLGVDLSPPKSFFYNDRKGTLLVRATLQDLDKIESAVRRLMVAPVQIAIKAKFIEMPSENAAAFWAFSPALSLPNSPRKVVLSPSRAKEQFKQWQTVPDVKILAETSITTLSGRECQIQVADDRPAKTRITSLQLMPTNQEGFPATGLGLIPDVQPDGSTIQLTVTPSVTEFIGYDNPGEFVLQDTDASEWAQPRSGIVDLPLDPPQSSLPPGIRPLLARLPLPHFRIRQVTTTEIVWDGQTLVIGGLSSTNLNPETDKVLINGQLFRNFAHPTPSKELIIFVTPVLIDPAGNRLHLDPEPEDPSPPDR